MEICDAKTAMEAEETGDPLLSVPSLPGLDLYLCKFCGDLAKQPVLNVICCHLFCWSCLYRDVKHKRRKGIRQCCPLCSSHLAISPPNSTIIRVCSGPQRGAVACPAGVDYEHMEKAKEVEKKIKVKGVPCRPCYEDASRHPSLGRLIDSLFTRYETAGDSICNCLELICKNKELHTEGIGIARQSTCELIQVMEYGELWWKGPEGYGADEENPVRKKDAVAKTGGRYTFKGKVKVKRRRVTVLRLSSLIFRLQLRKRDRLKKQWLLRYLNRQYAQHKHFPCILCHRTAYEPVVSKSGHLFCWTCLNSTGEFHYVGCPVTLLSDSVVSGSPSVCPIYHDVNYEAEDALLVANRPTGGTTQVPSRAHPLIAFEFLDFMINKVKEEGTEIINILDQVVSNWDEEEEDEIEDICRQVQGKVHALFVWLVTIWRQKSKERENEERYGFKLMTEDIVRDEYFEMAWKKLNGYTSLVADEDGEKGAHEDSNVTRKRRGRVKWST